MKVSREQAEQNRQHIVNVASRRFREAGFEGVSVADLMHEAGLTHGGFYGHFASKDDLAAEACARAFAEKIAKWSKLLPHDGSDPLPTLAEEYLKLSHRAASGSGCPLAALAVDASRSAKGIRQAFTQGFQGLVNVLSRAMPGRSAAANRAKALSVWSTLVGAMVLSRAVEDQRLAAELLQVAADTIGGNSTERSTKNRRL